MPKLSKEQFFSAGFAGQKMSLVTEIINLCLGKHAELTKSASTSSAVSQKSAIRKRIGGVVSEHRGDDHQLTAFLTSRAEMGPRSVESGGLSPPRPLRYTTAHAAATSPRPHPFRSSQSHLLDLSASSIGSRADSNRIAHVQQDSGPRFAQQPTSQGPGRGQGLYMIKSTLPTSSLTALTAAETQQQQQREKRDRYEGFEETANHVKHHHHPLPDFEEDEVCLC